MMYTYDIIRILSHKKAVIEVIETRKKKSLRNMVSVATFTKTKLHVPILKPTKKNAVAS